MDITTIESIAKKYPNLVHANNICVKLHAKDLTVAQQKALEIIVPGYVRYITANLNLVGFSEDVVRQRVALLNDYYSTFYPYNNTFSAQSKLRSTIMEEFLYILFKDFVAHYKHEFNDTKDLLRLGSAKAYTSLYLKSKDGKTYVQSVEAGMNQKDQDFAIYRPVSIIVDGKEHVINMPALAIEVKTYLDKTMYEGVVATAEKIKSGNPYTKFFVVTETYDVSFDVDPPLSRIDQIFVLRKSKRVKGSMPPPIVSEVVESIVRQAARHMESMWSNIQGRMEQSGELI